MKGKGEGRLPSSRKVIEHDHLLDDDDPEELSGQSLETLRKGYSWIRAGEIRHPGWHLSHVDGFPFTLPTTELSDLKVCLVSFAGAYRTGQKPFNTSPGVVPSSIRAMRFRGRGDWSFREIPADADSDDLLLAHAHYDHTEAEEDINCVFPLARLSELEIDGHIGECAEIHYSLMGYVPEMKRIIETAVREIIPRLERQGVAAVVVSGGCDLSHQSSGLVQREIEAAGIATVGVSVCHDITYQLQVPRAVSLRFPLGNPFGAAMDATMQTRILRDALSLLHTAKTPGEIVELPYDWVKDELS